MNSSSATLHPQLSRFLEGPTVVDRSEALTSLMAERVLSRYSKEPEFARGLAELIREATSGETPENRLLALAQMVRISQTLKPLSGEIRKSILPMLESPLPALNLVKTGDDRAYIAIACRWTRSDWVLKYAAQGVVEETAEKSRTELLGVLFSRASSFCEVLSLICEPMAVWNPGTDKPADTVCRRLTRILSAVRTEVASSRLPSGSKPGEVLANLIRRPMDLHGQPGEPKVKTALASEALSLVYAIVRSRLSLATDPTAYIPAKVVQKLFGTAGWPGKVHDEVELLVDLMQEAILLLAKQGIAAESLAEQMAIVVGDRNRAEALLTQLAIANPEVPENVRAWLRKEPVSQADVATSRTEASRELRVDPAVAEALLQSRRLEEGRQLLRNSIITSLSVLDPAQVPLAENLDARIGALAESVKEIATVRRLMLLGEVGTEQRHQPKFFEVVDGIPKEIVRILRPAVARIALDGSPGEVVLKGLVE